MSDYYWDDQIEYLKNTWWLTEKIKQAFFTSTVEREQTILK
ncbi:hypothetical protein OM416_10555 [Paenibacillus sp. LS1]|nr:hypothetical protein [Paenibacillus sp. LS1]MCW3792025.1 hypothetical protein [Paenibacillus sp. LS1]